MTNIRNISNGPSQLRDVFVEAIKEIKAGRNFEAALECPAPVRDVFSVGETGSYAADLIGSFSADVQPGETEDRISIRPANVSIDCPAFSITVRDDAIAFTLAA